MGKYFETIEHSPLYQFIYLNICTYKKVYIKEYVNVYEVSLVLYIKLLQTLFSTTILSPINSGIYNILV